MTPTLKQAWPCSVSVSALTFVRSRSLPEFDLKPLASDPGCPCKQGVVILQQEVCDAVMGESGGDIEEANIAEMQSEVRALYITVSQAPCKLEA